jgi:hypothetical protein
VVHSPEPIYYLTRSDLGRVFGVSARAVEHWQARWDASSGHPFLAPDAYAGNPEEGGSERAAPLWLPERLPEIKQWYATRPKRKGPAGRPKGSRLGGQRLTDT